jgi:hypothetical protein
MAYFNCKSLVKLTIPSKVTLIDESAFANCAKLENMIFSPNSTLKELGDQVFVSTGLVYLDLPPSVTTVGFSIISMVPTLKAMVMNRSLWAGVHSFLTENRTRYIYFHTEDVIYINQTSDVNDLVVDITGEGQSFFSMATIILVIDAFSTPPLPPPVDSTPDTLVPIKTPAPWITPVAIAFGFFAVIFFMVMFFQQYGKKKKEDGTPDVKTSEFPEIKSEDTPT